MLLQFEISSSDVLRIETEDIIEHYPGIVTLNKVFLLMDKLFSTPFKHFSYTFKEFFNLVSPPFSSRLAASPERRSQMEEEGRIRVHENAKGVR